MRNAKKIVFIAMFIIVGLTGGEGELCQIGMGFGKQKMDRSNKTETRTTNDAETKRNTKQRFLTHLIPPKCYTYKPTGPNSNSAWYQSLKKCGHDVDPPGAQPGGNKNLSKAKTCLK